MTIGSGVTVNGGNGGQGGAANTSWSYGVNATDNGAGGSGGNGVTAAGAIKTSIVNDGTIQGGKGALGGKFVMSDPSVRGAEGQGGFGIAGSNLDITNNASGTISGGMNAGNNSRRQAIYLTGGTNSIHNEGLIVGTIELAGGTTTLSGTYSNVLKINGGATLSLGADSATGFTSFNNAGGTINVGEENMLSAGTIFNSAGGRSTWLPARCSGAQAIP
ncbi:hypothetical protein C1M53_04150 [Mesorhizobium sp. Pch-S]|nr:hypothetical protein C1M53_04150 [Mesorhizobium sp. Pch-S]